ncbi:S1 family peptidase [Actinacidiphila glaucinigra]|uniref:S1 family peptidase n=1 Tax=Actinacidiphila glaucinigra TaxID=235986 RepID=UPI0038668373
MPITRPHVALTSALLSATAVAGALTAAPAHAVTGSPATSGSYAFTARIDIDNGARACSGALVDTDWIVTAGSCFVDDPASGTTPPAGKPAKPVTATIGRTDLTTTSGEVRGIVELVPRSDRDLVLARLSRPVTSVAPVKVSSTVPASGEQLTVTGYGRTKTEWAPLRLHFGTFSAGATQTTTTQMTGQNGAAVCAGDTGGPALRPSGSTYELVSVNSRSWQGGCFGQDTAETRTDAENSRVDDLGDWVQSVVNKPRISDFNCDGIEDVAVADPKATVDGDSGAGLIRVIYGGGKGTAEINQDLDWVPGGAEADDWFGESMDAVDYNQDGCTDIVVGTPSEDLGTATDAGMADILYGAPNGVGTGTLKFTHFEQGQGTGVLGASTPESGDRLGQSLAAGTTTAGEPFLVIGIPGESLGSIAKAGNALYVHGSSLSVVGISQDSTGVPGTAEANDGFGSVVEADATHIAIAAPNDAIGTKTGAGTAIVFDHKLNTEGKPTPLFGLDQDLDTVAGAAEAGDQFGASLAMISYRPTSSSTATDSILAVGSPGEDLDIDGAAKADAGNVITFRVTAAGTYSQITEIDSGTASDDVSGTSEAGDRFGQTLAAVNTAPRAVGSAATLKLAVGITGEAIGTTAKAGAITTFSLLGSPGANDHWIESGDASGIPGAPTANAQLGASLHFTATNLYVGMPYGPSTYGAVHSLPMSNVTAGGVDGTVTTFQPGSNGLPAAGARFGYNVR